jgi:hypothetical protein
MTYLLVLVALLLFLLASVIYAFKSSIQPNTSFESVESLKSFLGMNFGDDFEVVEHTSRNYHPDRPLKVTISVRDDVFSVIRNYVNGVKFEPHETTSSDGQIKYDTHWNSIKKGFIKKHSASYIDSKLPFFIESLTIDLERRMLSYSETCL